MLIKRTIPAPTDRPPFNEWIKWIYQIATPQKGYNYTVPQLETETE